MDSPYSPRASGFSLVEVLITIFLIAIALLGSAQLQAYSIKVTQAGQFRGQAVILGTDLLERIEANNAAAIAGAYRATLPGTAENAADCSAGPCTASQMAAYDLARFEQALTRQLPEASATVAFAGAGPYTYTVQVSWRERVFRPKSANSADQSKTESFSYTVSKTVYDRASVL